MTSSLESVEELHAAYAVMQSLIRSVVAERMRMAQANPHESIKWYGKAAKAHSADIAWARIGDDIARLLDEESDEPVRLDAQRVASDFALVKKFVDKEMAEREKLLRLHHTQTWYKKLSDAKEAAEAMENVEFWFYEAVQPGELVQAPVQAALF